MQRYSSYACWNNVATFMELESKYDWLLKSCNSLIPLKQLQSALTVSGLIRKSPHLSAQFIIKYSKFGDPQSSRSLFDAIQHGPGSFLWNTMLRAYANGNHHSQTLQLYSLMRTTGIRANNYTFPFVLKACAFQSLYFLGKLVHCDIVRSGFDSDIYVEAALVDMYAKCGIISDGRQVFDRMCNRDLVCWTVMITAYEQDERAEDVLALFHNMQEEGLVMDLVTAVCLASAIGQLGDAMKARSIHGYAIRHYFIWDVCFGNSIVTMYSKCGEVENARLAFDLMTRRDAITWNSMLSCYTQNGLARESLLLFDRMLLSDVNPDPVTALIMVSVCAYLGSRQLGRKIHDFIVDYGIEIDLKLLNAIMDMHAKCGDLGTAVEMFHQNPLKERNVNACNVLISGYGMHGFGREAVDLFLRMQEEGVQPNHITFTSLLSACSHAGLVDEGRRCFTDMARFSVRPEAKHYACMVDMLGRAGLLDDAYNLIKDMPSEPSDEIWGALLLACRIHGNSDLGEIAADNLFRLEPEHTGYYVLMSNIYAALNKWQDAGRLRQDMKIKGLRKPAAFSMVEFDDEIHVFHTADQVNPFRIEVYRKVESLAMEMKAVGYVPDHSCVLHDVEEEDKEHILNYHSEKLAVALGLMKIISPEMAIHVTKNLRVCNDCHSALKFISRIYGRKIIVRDTNRFHHFFDGSCSCKDYW